MFTDSKLWLRLGYTDHSAGHAPAGITGRLCFQVIRLFMHNHGVSQNGIAPAQLHDFVGKLEMRFARSVRLDVPEIPGVTIRRVGCSVLMIGRIEMASGGFGVGR